MTGLLDDAIEAHGGLERWQGISQISAHVRSGGLLMRTKGKADSFADYELTVSTSQPRAVLEPYPDEGRRGIFAGDRVRVESAAGKVVDERDGARAAFGGLGRLRRAVRWGDLDALYFAGYAMWNYLNLPFLLADPAIETTDSGEHREGGETWHRLDATFPKGFHTHSRRQSFYFDRRGLLRRHDYAPDVVAPFANAAHLSWAHEDFDGLVVPTRRRVTPRGLRGRPLRGPVVVWINVADVRAS